MSFGELLEPGGSSRIGSEYLVIWTLFRFWPFGGIFLRRLDRLDRSVSRGYLLLIFKKGLFFSEKISFLVFCLDFSVRRKCIFLDFRLGSAIHCEMSVWDSATEALSTYIDKWRYRVYKFDHQRMCKSPILPRLQCLIMFVFILVPQSKLNDSHHI